MKSTKLCDIEHQLRSKEKKIQQLESNLTLEQQNSQTYMADTNRLCSQVEKMQEIIFKLTRRKSSNNHDQSEDLTRTMFLSSLSLDSSKNNESLNETENDAVVTLKAMLKESQLREHNLQDLLHQKDTQLKDSQDLLNKKLEQKNIELENVVQKVEQLEKEMEALVEGLEVSANLGQVSTSVSEALNQRSAHLDQLDLTSSSLQSQFTQLSHENSYLRDQLKDNENLLEDFKSAQAAAREAREEARQERLNCAKLQQKCATLQAELDSTKLNLEQVIHQQQMKMLVHQVKQSHFGSFLEEMSDTKVSDS